MEYLPPLFRIVLIWRKQATESSSAEIWTLFRTKSRVHSFAYFFLHCSVWVKWLFKRYSRHFSTYIGVHKHGKSLALNFINIWQLLLYLDFLLFRTGIMDTAGRSTIPDRTSYQPQAAPVCRLFRISWQRNRGQDGLPLCQTVRSPSVYVDYVAFFLS